jgi:Ion channel
MYTYSIGVGLYFDFIDWVVVFYFLLEFILRYTLVIRFYVAQNKIIFLWSINTCVDIYTIVVPMVFLFIEFFEKKNNLYYHTSVVFRFFRFMQYIQRLFQTGQDEVETQLVKIFLTVLNLILTTAALVLAIENPYRKDWIENHK